MFSLGTSKVFPSAVAEEYNSGVVNDSQSSFSPGETTSSGIELGTGGAGLSLGSSGVKRKRKGFGGGSRALLASTTLSAGSTKTRRKRTKKRALKKGVKKGRKKRASKRRPASKKRIGKRKTKSSRKRVTVARLAGAIF